eukprot:bmy_02576T0
MWVALLRPLLRLLVLLLSPRDGVRAAQPQAPGYLIAAPSVFRSGVEEVISVTIFNSPREVMVQAQLVAQGEAVAQSQGAILDKGTIKLKVPTGLWGQALLKVWGRGWWAEEGPFFHNQTSVTVDSRGASVFIQTDKPVYRPQHRVLISIFTVTPDLRPVSEKLEAYVLDPRGSRMMEWRHLQPLCCGITNMTFPLSDQPVLGEWFIFVEMQGHVYNKSFEVQKYVLPKFELLIDPPRYIQDLDTCETGTVRARYTFGKPVSGTLTINMTVNGVGYYSQEVGRPILRTTKIHGSQDFNICVKDMILADVPEHFRGTVSIWAMVTSTDGSQQVAFDDSTPVQRQLVDVRYSKDTRKQFKPGLSYVGKPSPAPAAEVNVCVTSLRLTVTPSMVPLGRLLAFYVRENGEGVADSLQFAVETFFENQVFRELEDYDVSDAFGVSREDGPFWWAGLMARRRRRSSIFLWPWGVTKDSGFAFAVYVKISVPKGIQFVGHPGKRHLTKKTCVVPGEMEPSWVVLSFGDLGLSNITAVSYVCSIHWSRSVQTALEDRSLKEPPGHTPTALSSVPMVGHGPEPSNDSVIMAWTLPKPPEVQFIGFSTGWGSVGEFRIWRKVEVDESYSEAFTLGVPHSAIPGSERAAASIIGDVMGPTLNHLSNHLRLPFGCGEQNMIHFAPNVFVLKYLQKTRQLSPEVERETTDYLVQGYQRQLTYKHQDGSYSAFGERDKSGSMWLTAFVLKSFAQARSFIFIDPQELAAAKGWIVQQQRADGSFPAVGRILNKDIQGGIHGTVPLTAYVVAALLEMGLASEEERGAIAKARHFLESGAPLAVDPYSSALTAYALTLLRSPAAPAALRKLRSLAITQDGVTHWSLTGSRDVDKDAFLSFSDGVYQTVVSAEVEMTAYALLTYTLLGDVATALPVVKWLSQQRNALGGFSSTQDTCVALQALAEYAILSYAGGINLTLSLASTNLDYQETFELHRANQKLLQMAAVRVPRTRVGGWAAMAAPPCCLSVHVCLWGKPRHLLSPDPQPPHRAVRERQGRRLLPDAASVLPPPQIDVTYNVPDPVAKPSFQLLVNLQEPEAERRPPAPASSADDDDPAADQHQQEYPVTLEVCTRWLHTGSSNMAVLEVPLLSGFRADVESLEQLLLDKHVALKRYEVAGRRVLFYFDEIPSGCLTCVRFRALRQHVVGRTSALPISVYDYYEPAFEATRFYNVSSRSPLARELCAGPACNEVERALAQGPGWSPGEGGPAAIPEEGTKITRCGCARDCATSGDPVCGSDGVVYATTCHLQEAACRGRVRLEPAPPSRCALEQPTPASALYSYDYDLGPLDAGHVAAGHEVVDLDGETEDSQSGFSS